MTTVQRPDLTASSPRQPARAADPETPAPTTAALVIAHQTMVWRYLRLLGADPHEADDLMQDTFVCVAEVLHRGEPVHAPAAFLRGIARNLLIGARRSARSKGPTVEWADAVDRLANEPTALEDGRIEALRRCISRLAGRARQVVEWHHVDGLSYRQVAQRLGIGVQGIKSLLGRAREALRQCIDQQVRGES